tara:strand:- start:135 stop:317 length:183 start_codon:yes stop_codon:yes gene_type:complete
MQHLKDRNVSYFGHMFCATKYAIKLYLASQVLLIHAIVPSLFETTASDIIKGILQETTDE